MELLMKKEFPSFFSMYAKTLFVVTITLICLGLNSITPNDHQTVSAQQQLSEVNQSYSNLKHQPNFQGLVFDIDGIPFSHHMATVNGIQMHYVIGGQGEPIVLLHGFPETWYEWRHVMPSLAKNYTVIVPDLRGLGDSSKPITGYDGRTTAEDIYQLVSQLGFNKIFLVGHDFGAEWHIHMLLLILVMLSRLVILDVPIPGIGTGKNITSFGGFNFIWFRTSQKCLSKVMKESILLIFIDILRVTLQQSHKMILTNMLVIILLQVVCELDSNITELF